MVHERNKVKGDRQGIAEASIAGSEWHFRLSLRAEHFDGRSARKPERPILSLAAHIGDAFLIMISLLYELGTYVEYVIGYPSQPCHVVSPQLSAKLYLRCVFSSILQGTQLLLVLTISYRQAQ